MARAETEGDWFAVVDAARDPRLRGLIEQSSKWVCLFAGDVPPVLAAASPHLVKLAPGEPLFEVWKAEGQGKSWGVMLRSDRPLEVLRKHFRQFLQAKMPDGTVVLFRYYDPRVFNAYIRAATPEERAPWFDGVTLFSVEDKDPKAHHGYTLSGGELFDNGKPVAAVAA